MLQEENFCPVRPGSLLSSCCYFYQVYYMHMSTFEPEITLSQAVKKHIDSALQEVTHKTSLKRKMPPSDVRMSEKLTRTWCSWNRERKQPYVPVTEASMVTRVLGTHATPMNCVWKCSVVRSWRSIEPGVRECVFAFQNDCTVVAVVRSGVMWAGVAGSTRLAPS